MHDGVVFQQKNLSSGGKFTFKNDNFVFENLLRSALPQVKRLIDQHQISYESS